MRFCSEHPLQFETRCAIWTPPFETPVVKHIKPGGLESLDRGAGSATRILSASLAPRYALELYSALAAKMPAVLLGLAIGRQ